MASLRGSIHVGADGPADTLPLPLTAMTIEEVARAIFYGAAPESLVGLLSCRPGPGARHPYIHWYAPVAVAKLHSKLRVVADSVAGPRYWLVHTLSPSVCRDAAARRLEWNGKPIYFSAKGNGVSELCSILIDLDVGRPEEQRQGSDLSADEAIDCVRGLIVSGVLPSPSLVARSGRGVYLIYLLTESHATARRPVTRTAESEAQWKRVATGLGELVRHLACDISSSRTVAHPFKAPGATNEPAFYFAATDDIQHIRYWSLDELGQVLPAPVSVARRENVEGVRRRGGRSGDPAQPIRRRIRELEDLARYRPITEGIRHYFLLYYVSDLIRLQFHDRVPMNARIENALKCARDINQLFDTPLRDDEVQSFASVDASFRKRQRNTTVGDALRVTKTEVLMLRLRSVVPSEVAQQRQASADAKKKSKQRRRQALDALIRRGASTAEIRAGTGYSKSAICKRRRELSSGLRR